VKSRWVRRHIASFEGGVLGTAKFRAVQLFKNKSENAKFLYNFWGVIRKYRFSTLSISNTVLIYKYISIYLYIYIHVYMYT